MFSVYSHVKMTEHLAKLFCNLRAKIEIKIATCGWFLNIRKTKFHVEKHLLATLLVFLIILCVKLSFSCFTFLTPKRFHRNKNWKQIFEQSNLLP